MQPLNSMQRSRLKLTIFGASLMFIALLFPIYIINKAAQSAIFELNAVWVAFGTTVTTIGGIIGYYVSRETFRPSLLTNTTIIQDALTPDENDVGESDPADIPL